MTIIFLSNDPTLELTKLENKQQHPRVRKNPKKNSELRWYTARIKACFFDFYPYSYATDMQSHHHNVMFHRQVLTIWELRMRQKLAVVKARTAHFSPLTRCWAPPMVLCCPSPSPFLLQNLCRKISPLHNHQKKEWSFIMFILIVAHSWHCRGQLFWLSIQYSLSFRLHGNKCEKLAFTSLENFSHKNLENFHIYYHEFVVRKHKTRSRKP